MLKNSLFRNWKLGIVLVLSIIFSISFSSQTIFAGELITKYNISPGSATCQDNGLGWAAGNCDDTSYSADRTCPAGGSGEYTFCDDSSVEVHTAKRSLPGGVRVFFNDTSQFTCENIHEVKVHYKMWFDNTRATKTLSVDADGDGWTSVTFTEDSSEPGSIRSVDVTNSLTGGETWDCEDFFNSTSTAGLETLWSVSAGPSQTTYTLSVDVLYYEVTYNSTIDELYTDKISYSQLELVKIFGIDIWPPNANVTINITRNDSIVETFNNIPINSSGDFTFNYSIGEYYTLGNYKIYAQVQGNASINASDTFEVTKRNPQTFSDRTYYSPGDLIKFTGINWAKNMIINVTRNFLSGAFEGFTGSFISNNNNTINYSYTLNSSLISPTIPYQYLFVENNDTSYNSTKTINVVFKPENSTINVTLINHSDNQYYELSGGGTLNYDFAFGPILPVSSYFNLTNVTFGIEYSTSGTPTTNLQWYNDSSTTYQNVCSISVSAADTIKECNILSYSLYNNDSNSMKFRINRVGVGGDNFKTDIVYLKRNFSILPLEVNLITPANMSITNDSSNILFKYNVSGHYPVANCKLYIDGSQNNVNTTITKNINQTLVLNGSLVKGLYNWSVGCTENNVRSLESFSETRILNISFDSYEIDLISPNNGSKIITNDGSVNLIWQVRDNPDISSCDLYIDGILNSTYSCSGNEIINASKNFTRGTYDWYINLTNPDNQTFISETRTFSVIPGKHLKISKKIENVNSNLYTLNIDIENLLSIYADINFIDFVDQNFVAGSFSPSYDFTNNSNGPNYNGKIYDWNLTVANNSLTGINYSITGVGSNYDLSKSYMVGLE